MKGLRERHKGRCVRAVGVSVQTRTVQKQTQYPSSKPIQYKYDIFNEQVFRYVTLRKHLKL